MSPRTNRSAFNAPAAIRVRRKLAVGAGGFTPPATPEPAERDVVDLPGGDQAEATASLRASVRRRVVTLLLLAILTTALVASVPGLRGALNVVTNLIPDVSQFYRSDYVANGFDITWGVLLFLNTILPVAGYLLPWGVLAYYLMKSREIANPT